MTNAEMLHIEIEAVLTQWEDRGNFNAGDAATDVIALLVELGIVE